MENAYQEFISRLKKLYGAFDETHKKFAKAPNSEIARDLGYSDAQFSRLVNESATEGEYARANQNAQRILSLLDLEKKLKDLPTHSRKKQVFIGIGLVVIGLLIGLGIDNSNKPPIANDQSRYGMLKWAFESNFIKPYKGLRDLPADCNYECYKYQGRWELKNEYKLPFLRESSGFHYLAKSVTSYIRCTPENNSNGKSMQGYEYQEHEIWYDILERPIGNFITQDGTQKEIYKSLIFDKDEDFILIGTIHSFYVNDFELDSNGIRRRGQDIGRDLEFIPEEILASQLKNKSLLEKIKREITLIIQDPLRDFSKPSNCLIAEKPRTSFHDLANGDEMTFNCEMNTAGRFPISYSKSYVLKDQYIKDKCVEANEQ